MALDPVRPNSQDGGAAVQGAASTAHTGGLMPAHVSRSAPSESNGDESTSSDTATSGNSTDGTEPLSYAPEEPSAQRPPIADQIAEIEQIERKPLVDGQKGFIVAKRWIDRVKAHAPSAIGSGPNKLLSAEPLGPVDNSELVPLEYRSVNNGKTDEQHVLLDEKGEPFVKLNEGQHGIDFEVFTETSWQLMVKWYGVKHGSPTIIRYIHNANPRSMFEDLKWEFWPPVISAYILNASQEAVPVPRSRLQILGRPSLPYQAFLKKLKLALNMDLSTKVRIWRLLSPLPPPNVSGIPTPAASRETSPSPPTATSDVEDQLHLGIDRFGALMNGSQRELINIQDQTHLPASESQFTLQQAGLGVDCTIVIETQLGGPAGGEWPANNINSASTSQILQPPSQAADTGRTTPRTFGAIPTRGRLRNGRAIGACGLSNLGNTCYMNSALQCVRSVEELTRYFVSRSFTKEVNTQNPLGYKGQVANAYAGLLDEMYKSTIPASVGPRHFKATVGRADPRFSGYQQQDSQEFVGFLLDGLSEDLNRIQKKPYTVKPDSTDEMVDNPAALYEMADKCWDMYKARNDSPVVDLFAGSYKSTLVCPVCRKVSITFDPFTNLTLHLPIPNLWSYRVKYYPVYDPPLLLDVDLPKSASIFDLKVFIADRMRTDPRRLFGAEVWKGKVYKIYPDTKNVAEEITQVSGDSPVFWELDDVPTQAHKPKKPMVNVDNDEEEETPKATSNVMIPVYMRRPNPNRNQRPRFETFGDPFYMLFNEAEANDYRLMRQKILAKISTTTTKYLARFNEDEESEEFSDAKENASTSSTEGSGIIVDPMDTTTDKAVESNQETLEVEFVDIPGPSSQASQKDHPLEAFLRRIHRTAPADPNPVTPAVRDLLERPVPRELESLFEIKFSSGHDPIGTGWSSMSDADEYQNITTRIPVEESAAEGSEMSDSANATPSEEDTDDPDPPTDHSTHSFVVNHENDTVDSDHSDLPTTNSMLGRKPDSRNRHHFNKIRDSKKKRGPLNVRKAGLMRNPKRKVRTPPADVGPLIRQGEVIVLDWNDDSYDIYYGGVRQDDIRGQLMMEDDSCSAYPDPDLEKARKQRKTRVKNGISLDDCLDAFGKEEILAVGDEWYCPRCKEHRRASKKFELWRTPDILIIHLKRFSSSSRRDKLDIMVDFPTTDLDLTGRVGKTMSGKSEVYDLFGVDNHYGGLGGGHYTAYARNWVDGSWNDYNDSVVTRTEAEHVVTSSAYLLFYRRRSPTPLGGPLFERICAHQFVDAETDMQIDDPSDSSQQQPAGDGHPLGSGSRAGLPSAFSSVPHPQQGQPVDRSRLKLIESVQGASLRSDGGAAGSMAGFGAGMAGAANRDGMLDPPSPGEGQDPPGYEDLGPAALDVEGGYTGNQWNFNGLGNGMGSQSMQELDDGAPYSSNTELYVAGEDPEEDLMDGGADDDSVKVHGSPNSEEWPPSGRESPMPEERLAGQKESSLPVAEVHVEEGEGLVHKPPA